MTPDERDKFLERSRAMRAGTPAERAQRRHDRAAREAFAQMTTRPPEPVSPEIAALDARIVELEAQIAASKQRTA
jgi:hypothetical protein